ncbi:hypothetical protein G9F71_008675 [Clostridium sp. FP2]|uniref:ATP-dependent DNA ligase n=1 Tax=Clostridium sp. FP2 TaxID=2724481 RepID=UPI0013E918C4|nr:hypothetical protein [Clostridium sp. FP2]MBZ9622927.1 hypothetical protein [Clostridium sp. FP2]
MSKIEFQNGSIIETVESSGESVRGKVRGYAWTDEKETRFEGGIIMNSVIQIVKELEETSSTNSKQDILKREAGNELFTKVLYCTFSDHLMYGFSEKKLRELLSQGNIVKELRGLIGDDMNESKTWSDVFEMLEELSVSNINSDLRDRTILFLLSQTEEIRELYIKMLTKDLRCSISAKGINKAIKGLIKVWDIQQAYSIDKVKLKKSEWIALSLKLNGIRSTLMNEEFKSRQNKPMNGLDHVLEDLKQLNVIDNFVIDGEMVRKNIDNVPDNENFRLTASILNSDSGDKSQIEYVVFDIVPKEEFVKGESKLGFKDRLDQLNRLKELIATLGLKNIRIAPTYYTGTDHSMIETLLTKVDSEGYEGLMCIRDMPYKAKRNNGILKCKVFKTCDIKIVGFEEGDGRLKGTLGAVVVQYKDNVVNVGSGYTDAERKDIWENKDTLLGRIVEVKFKEESMDKGTGLVSLQFPTFVCLRETGKEVSYN